MGYSYGHEKTAYTGICLWLQNFKWLKQSNDSNKMFAMISKIMVSYLKTINKEPIKLHYKSGKINEIRTAQIIQKDFKPFMDWVNQNEQELKSTFESKYLNKPVQL